METTNTAPQAQPLETEQSAHETKPASADVVAEARRRPNAERQDSDWSPVTSAMRFGSGIREDEQADVIEALRGLDDGLAGLDPATLEMEAWVRGRSTPDQTTYLRLRSGAVDLVAHSDAASFSEALTEVKDRMRRQLSDVRRRKSQHRR